jgi:hypothetical protein
MRPLVYFAAMRRHHLLIGGLALALLALAGCGQQQSPKNKVASAGGTTTPSSTAGAAADKLTDQQRAVKFAQCMRAHGVNMPDPKFSDGGRGVSISIPRGVSKEKVDKAQAACKQYLPNGGEPPKVDPKITEQLRKFAQCMRAHGVPKFPDPQTSNGGGIAINADNGVNPESPTFKAAEKACKSLMPQPKGGGDGPATSRGDG